MCRRIAGGQRAPPDKHCEKLKAPREGSSRKRRKTCRKARRKKIPALRRANDTPFDVSERSANWNRASGKGTTLLLTTTPAQREAGPAWTMPESGLRTGPASEA